MGSSNRQQIVDASKQEAISIIFEKWKSAVRFKDKSKKHIADNFDELFAAWRAIGATFEELSDGWLQRAINTHMPDSTLIKKVFRNLKLSGISGTEREFGESWKASIEKRVNEIFLNYFSPSKIEVAQGQEQSIYGSMSATEYFAQRSYADSFPARFADDIKNVDSILVDDNVLEEIRGILKELNSGREDNIS
jgi:hypothetical protein